MKTFLTLILFCVSNFIAWNYLGLMLVVTIACLFWLMNNLEQKKPHVAILLLFLITFLFNISATFWLMEVSWWESLLAFFGNSFVMLIPLVIVFFLKKKYGYQLLFFSVFWILFEILHTKWDLAWPWLTFGHALGNQFYLIQWYSLVGVYAGSLWLIALGYLLEKAIHIKERKQIIKFCSLLLLPSVFSLFVYYNKNAQEGEAMSVITYTPKNQNSSTNYNKAKHLYFDIKKYSAEAYLVCPEIFFSRTDVNNLKTGMESVYLNRFLKEFKTINLIFGVEIKDKKNKLYNSVISLSGNDFLLRSKKKYVPLREFTPEALTGIFGRSYYGKSNPDAKDTFLKASIFPTVCYETVFSEFTAENSIDSEVIFALTSEEFMNDSYFAKRQYLNIIRVRAIENNRNILKCSNKGISCVINEKGEITRKIDDEIQTVTVQKIKAPSLYQKIISLL